MANIAHWPAVNPPILLGTMHPPQINPSNPEQSGVNQTTVSIWSKPDQSLILRAKAWEQGTANMLLNSKAQGVSLGIKDRKDYSKLQFEK